MPNSIKQALYRRMALTQNVTAGSSIHVGPGSRLWAPTSLHVGNNVYIGRFCTIEVDGVIGDGVLIANSVGIVGRRDHDAAEIGVPIRAARWVGDHPDMNDRTFIGSDVWLGYGAIVLGGSTIGDSTIIAAGAVVTGDLPENAICAGSPAQKLRDRFSPANFRDHWAGLKATGVRPLNEVITQIDETIG